MVKARQAKTSHNRPQQATAGHITPEQARQKNGRPRWLAVDKYYIVSQYLMLHFLSNIVRFDEGHLRPSTQERNLRPLFAAFWPDPFINTAIWRLAMPFDTHVTVLP